MELKVSLILFLSYTQYRDRNKNIN